MKLIRSILGFTLFLSGIPCMCMQFSKKQYTEHDREMAPLAVLYAAQVAEKYKNPDVLSFFEKLRENIEQECNGKGGASSVTVRSNGKQSQGS